LGDIYNDPARQTDSQRIGAKLKTWRLTMKTAITPTEVSSDESIASRRSFVAAAVALGVVGTTEAADAQTPQNPRFQNPSGLSAPRGYSHVVEVTAPGRMVYIAGQTGVDAGGRVPEGFRAQATQVFENLKIALASAGAGFEHVVKLNSYLTDIPAQLPTLREVRESYLNKAAPPASTTVQVSALADPRYLIEVEATAILPQRG
jgi:enamine deaminase RidA (YjgF/YER057c/UK114 family)